MKKSMLVFGFLLLAGCTSTPNENSIHYFKDSRTGLCFASWGVTMQNNFNITCVPCNEQVLERIKNDE